MFILVHFIAYSLAAMSAVHEDTNAPNACLYINNINEKIKIDVLKKMFNMLFSQYGKVSSIVAYSTLKSKGQAWVQFENEKAATAALKGKQDFNFYDKPLRIQYARGIPKDKEQKTGGVKRSGAAAVKSSLQDETGEQAPATKRAKA